MFCRAGLVAMAEMPIILISLALGFDGRKLIVLGMLIAGGAAWWMSHLNLQVAEHQVIWPRIMQVLGSGMLFVPINTIAYRYIPKSQTSNASGLFSLIRNEAASIGVALVTTLLQRHAQVHQASLVSHINSLDPMAMETMHRAAALFGAGDPNAAAAGALRLMYLEVQRQAAILSYLEMFRLFSLMTVLVIPLVFLMRRGTVTKEAMEAH